MNKSDLVTLLAKRYAYFEHRDMKRVVDTILASIGAWLAQGRRVEIRDFGVFALRYRAARTGRNPATGEKVLVPARYVPFYKMGKLMRARLMPEDQGGVKVAQSLRKRPPRD